MSQIQLIQAALRLLAELGVREICVAAGARNAPVLTALLHSQNIRLWNFFEERSAAFFALGRIHATGRPVAVLTTSGTAAAELLPAVIESHYQSLPLIAFTADRPKSFRGTGAPQAIEQANLFTPYASVVGIWIWPHPYRSRSQPISMLPFISISASTNPSRPMHRALTSIQLP